MPLRVQSAPRVRVPQPYWGYEDIGIFFFALVFLASVVRLGVQCAIIILLSIALYVVLKCRHHLPVVAPLGWVAPNVFYTAVAPVAGITAALGIVLLIHLRHQVMPTMPVIDFLGLVLGPILEESVFRGCLLPVVARTFGGAFAVIATALLFAVFHGPTDLAHWCWFTATGVAYGWLRLASQTTTAAAFMHATDNLTLFLAARL